MGSLSPYALIGDHLARFIEKACPGMKAHGPKKVKSSV